MTAAGAAATAAVFTWLGMVVAISFLEAPLKFRAPGVTVRIALGIGRLVFRGLNTAEAILATVLLVSAAAAALRQPPSRCCSSSSRSSGRGSAAGRTACSLAKTCPARARTTPTSDLG